MPWTGISYRTGYQIHITEPDADWWLRMVTENDGKNGIWRAIEEDGQIVGSRTV